MNWECKLFAYQDSVRPKTMGPCNYSNRIKSCIAGEYSFCTQIFTCTNFLGAYNMGPENYLLFSEPDFDISPFSSANLSGRSRESDASNFLGAVSKLLILWAKYV